MLKSVNQRNDQDLYKYYTNYLVGQTSYYHKVSKESWTESFFEDIDYEGEKKYRDLKTYCSLATDGTIDGFIQFGFSNYGYDEEGEKSFEKSAGIIRQLHFLRGKKAVGKELLSLAVKYFQEQKVELSFAFFHALGLTFTGNHGKLHESMTQVEELLLDHGFNVEHSNIYYVRKLGLSEEKDRFSLSVKQGEKTENDTQMFTFYEGKQPIGQANIAYLPDVPIAYLRWIFLIDEHQNKGYGSQAVEMLIDIFNYQGLEELHTDTADVNKRAQHVYEKNGFEYAGVTRSYMI